MSTTQVSDPGKHSPRVSEIYEAKPAISQEVISDDEVANFRGALHDDESPALTSDGQIIRRTKKFRSAYFPDVGRGSPAGYDFATRQGHFGSPGLGHSKAGLAHQSAPDAYSIRPSSSSPLICSHTVPTISTPENLGEAIARMRGGSLDSENEPHEERMKEENMNNNRDEAGEVDRDTDEASLPSATLSKGKRGTVNIRSSPDTDTDSRATLPPFDLEDFKARRDAANNTLDAELVKEQKRGEKLMEMLRVWNEVARLREGERAEARANIRIAKMQQEEEALRGTEAHRKSGLLCFWLFQILRLCILNNLTTGDQIIGALKNVLGMLDDGGVNTNVEGEDVNMGDEADDEDEEGDDHDDHEE